MLIERDYLSFVSHMSRLVQTRNNLRGETVAQIRYFAQVMLDRGLD